MSQLSKQSISLRSYINGLIQLYNDLDAIRIPENILNRVILDANEDLNNLFKKTAKVIKDNKQVPVQNNKLNTYDEALRATLVLIEPNKFKFIHYLKSFEQLYDEKKQINVFVNGNTEQNDTFETSLKCDILSKWSSSSKLRDFLTNKHTITLDELILFVITVPDDYTLGENDEFFRAILVLLGSRITNILLPDYDKLINKSDEHSYSALYKIIGPRFETKVAAYLRHRIFSHPFFKYLKSYFKIVRQVHIKNKIYDFCIFIWNGSEFVNRLMIEIQEDGGNHEYSPNDIDKKIIAIHNKVEIMYFRKAEYNIKNNQGNYLNNVFWSDFEPYLMALLLNADVYCRRKYLELPFIRSKAELDNLENQLEIEEDEDRCEKINDAIVKLKIKTSSENDMLKIFDWKELSQKNKKGAVINLTDVLRMANINDAQSVIKRYKINNLIDWKVMMKIFSSCVKIDLRDNLIDYLTEVEDNYEKIIYYKDKYQAFINELNDWYRSYQDKQRENLYNRELEAVKHDLRISNGLRENTNLQLKEVVQSSLAYKNMIDTKNIQYSADDNTIKNSHQELLHDLILLDKKKDNYIKKKYDQPVKQFISKFNTSDDKQLIFKNRPDIKIMYDANNETKTVKFSNMVAYCLERGVQPSICKQYASSILHGISIEDDTEIPFLEFVDNTMSFS